MAKKVSGRTPVSRWKTAGKPLEDRRLQQNNICVKHTPRIPDLRKRSIGCLPLSEAAFPVEAIIRRLRRDGYTGWVTLEPHVPVEALLEYYKVEIPYMLAQITKL